MFVAMIVAMETMTQMVTVFLLKNSKNSHSVVNTLWFIAFTFIFIPVDFYCLKKTAILLEITSLGMAILCFIVILSSSYFKEIALYI